MLLKEEEHRNYLVSVFAFLGRGLWNKKAIIAYLLVIFFIGNLFGAGMSGFFGSIDNPSPAVRGMAEKALSIVGLTDGDAVDIWQENLNIPKNYFKGIMSDPEHIDIDIKFDDFQRIAYKREIALVEGIHISSGEDYVPAQIRYQGKSIDVNLRLKGDLSSHWAGDKWSFRIKVRGDDTLFGLRVFSIQAPETRGFMNEWLFHQALKREGLIGLRYEFIDVSINGEHKGVYALEEHFEKRLIENNGYREGPLIKFDETILWADRVLHFPSYVSDLTGLQSMYSAEIDVFRGSSTYADPVLLNQFLKAQGVLESFRNGELETHQVFDVAKLAKYMAFTDLMGAIHGLPWHNLRFYYNPITSLLEPIGFDANAGSLITGVIGTNLIDDDDLVSLFLRMLFDDSVFFERYAQELERFSQKSYLDNLLVELDDGLQRNIAINYRDHPWYRFSTDVFYSNQDIIRKTLNPVKGFHAYLSRVDGNSALFEVGNIQSFPIEIINISYDDGHVLIPGIEKNILRAKEFYSPVKYEIIEFTIPEGINYSTEIISNMKLNYRLLGTSQLRSEEIYTRPHPLENFVDNDIIRQESNVAEFEFLVVDNINQKISVAYGDWELSENLIIPAGYTVICREGTRIELKNNATILSYSPLNFIGSEDNPIKITSSGGQGLTVINADTWSVMENVAFQSLAAPSQSGWELTGSVTFYESPVNLSGCQFLDNATGDDMLNIVRSEFEIANSLFKNSLFDAIDIDSGEGIISHTSIVNSGNDGIDFSGSVAEITGFIVNGADDKGVSAGENSQITIKGIELKDCYIAIASKDMSQVDVEDAKISNCEIGLAVYQKKSEFGPSEMVASSTGITNTTTSYLVEEFSRLLADNREITNFQKNVYQMLYGED
ncbi:CotH kinase family protein [Chloroflexota bacterium]